MAAWVFGRFIQVEDVMNQVSGAGQPAAPERSTAELVEQVAEQVSVLVRDELKLARVEMAHKGKQAGAGLGMLGGSGLIALYGVGCLIACVIIAISHVLTAWLAVLIVGAALLAIAGVAAMAGKGRMQKAVPPVPRQAASNVRADVRETRERARR
jgi:uncharacterized membrane protein YqjE